MTTNIFIDCGTNLGQGLKRFDKKLNLFNNPEWDIHTFEPNKHINLDTVLPHVKNLTRYKKAVWLYDGTIKFLSKGKTDKYVHMRGDQKRFQGGGSQLSECKDKAELPVWDEEDESMVECINFGEFLKQFSDEKYNVVVKIDIEGAEEKLVEQLIDTGAIMIIDKLYMETHGRFHFSRDEWDIPSVKNSISTMDDALIKKCRQYISYVEKWD
jgi:FkbM family methyltransferase